ncbi:MAG TPA: HAD hydrolase family protein, partial [Spirochaetota bacterium]|nr:HAD hydrolase family protein [Spirochaetota bacterium]
MLIVLSDLDGTLLDHDTYSYDESLPGISMLREKRVPLVLVSSKTYDEMVLLHQELELEWPFVFENGGGIAYPREGGSCSITVFGPGSDSLIREVECLSKLLGSEIFPIAS